MSANKFKVGDKVKVRKGLVADGWYTAEQLKMDGFEFFDPQVKTIEINGKKYKKVDVEEAIKDLEVVE